MMNLNVCKGSYPFEGTKETMKQRDGSSRIHENSNEVGKCRKECNRVPDQLRLTGVRSLKEAVPSPPNLRTCARFQCHIKRTYWNS
jgi:hypothetical protein